MKKIFFIASFMLLFMAASLGVVNTNKIKSESMTAPPSTVSIDYETCISCGDCIEADPLHYIEFVDEYGVGFFGIENSVYILPNDYERGIYTNIAMICPVHAIFLR